MIFKIRGLKILVSVITLMASGLLFSGTWTAKASMPTPRANPAGAAVNDSVYVIGGTNSGSYYGVNEVYDPLRDTWTTKSPMPVNQCFCRAVALDGKIYVVGIVTWNGPAFLQEYDPVTDTWAAKTPMNVVRHSFAVGAANGKIYVIGGITTPNIYLQDNEEYDPNTNTWTTKAPMPTARGRLTMGVWYDMLYCVGGNDSDSTYAKNEAYDPGRDSWTTMSEMITARYGLTAGTIADTIYFVGGAFSMDRQLNEGYVPATNSWFSDAPMPTGRGYLAVASANNKLYAIGGLRGFDYLNTNEEFGSSVGMEESRISGSKCQSSVLEVYPNPFSKKTEIRWTSYDLRSTMIRIYDATGRLVKSFPLSTDYYLLSSVVWFGTDDLGRKVPAGVYFVRLEASDYQRVEKVIFLR